MTCAIATADPISEAALSLRDDPTFALMSDADASQEARDLLTSLGGDADDPLSVALVLEAARAAPPVTHDYAPPPGFELCGEKRAVCNATVAGNGRCMECGSKRAPPVVQEAPEQPKAEAPARVVAAPAQTLSQAPYAGMPLLYRVKLVTGMTEPQLAELIGKKRATVQAYISGRLPEILDAKARERITDALTAQEIALFALRQEMALAG